MSKLTLVEVYQNKDSFARDVSKYIREYKLDIGLQNADDFKEEFQDALRAFSEKQHIALELAKAKTRIRKMKFNQDI